MVESLEVTLSPQIAQLPAPGSTLPLTLSGLKICHQNAAGEWSLSEYVILQANHRKAPLAKISIASGPECVLNAEVPTDTLQQGMNTFYLTIDGLEREVEGGVEVGW